MAKADRHTIEYTSEFDVKAVLGDAEERIMQSDGEWEAARQAQEAFEVRYPKADKPDYEPVAKITPRLVDHSMGYVGVSFRDNNNDGRMFTLLFSKANDVHEVYMTDDDLRNLSNQIHTVLQHGVMAQEKRRQHEVVVEAWNQADRARRDALGKLEKRAKNWWKRLKKQGKLVDPVEDVDEDGIPF